MRGESRPVRSLVLDVLVAAGASAAAAWVVDVVLAIHWTPQVVGLEDGEALVYPSATLWVIAGVGGVLVVAGLRLGFERQFHNWLFVGLGISVAVLGTTFAACERVEITSDRFAVRRWWGLESRAWRYEDLDAINVVSHHRRRGNHWITIKVEPKPAAGSSEEVRVPRLFAGAQLALQTAARSKDVRVGWAMDSRR